MIEHSERSRIETFQTLHQKPNRATLKGGAGPDGPSEISCNLLILRTQIPVRERELP